MTIIILDTNILIDHVHGYARWLDDLLLQSDTYHCIVPSIVVTEYVTAKEIETKEGQVASDEYLHTFRIQDLTYDIAQQVGTLLRRKTYPPGADVSDLIVAATALCMDGRLATNNRKHFQTIPDLRFFDAPEK